MVETRKNFESELNKLSGLEFRVVQSHMNYGDDVDPGEGRWVIRKQLREKKPGQPDKTMVLSTFFVIGELIVMAPSIGNVLWGKLIDSMQKFDQMVALSSEQPLFTPALGHHYFHQSSKPDDSVQIGSTIPSRAGSMSPVSEEIQITGSQDLSDGTKSSSRMSNQSILKTRAFSHAYQIFSRYGNEYMEDVELVGQPGSFGFRRQDVSKQAGPPNIAAQAMQADQAYPSQSTTPQQFEASINGFTRDGQEPSEQTRTDSSPPSTQQRPKPKRQKTKVLTSTTSPHAAVLGQA